VPKKNTSGTVEFCAITVFALSLYLPYRAIQYDLNGIGEAQYIESGQLFNRNHMLYRPVGYAVYSATRTVGYKGNALGVLQVMSAVFGAIGVGFCYLVCRAVVDDTRAALLGAFWLATSFIYWYSSTDAGYIVLAGLFVAAAMASAVADKEWPAAIATTFSVFTWQANIFALPVISTLTRRFAPPSPSGSGNDFNCVPLPLGEGGAKRRVRVAVATLLLVTATYIAIAWTQGQYTPVAILHWASSYNGATLPLWGTWSWDWIPAASISAVRSILPILLAARPSELTQHVQLGRIAVDIALLAFIVLIALAALRAHRKSLYFLAGYAIYLPFIIWWDPHDPKWFLVPNIFLAVFLASALAPWLKHKYMRFVVLACVLALAGTNFITTMRPRHARLGPDREMAQCVAEHMTSNDLLVSAEWGWSEYLPYLHQRPAINLINDGVQNIKDGFDDTRRRGGSSYMVDPQSYSQEHIDWLKNQTGITREMLLRYGGTPAFACNGIRVLQVN
jgi:hypothetical protein